MDSGWNAKTGHEDKWELPEDHRCTDDCDHDDEDPKSIMEKLTDMMATELQNEIDKDILDSFVDLEEIERQKRKKENDKKLKKFIEDGEFSEDVEDAFAENL